MESEWLFERPDCPPCCGILPAGPAKAKGQQHRLSHLAVIRRLLDNLWRHPERCPHESTLLVEGASQLASHSKIGHLDIAHFRQQDIGG